MPLLETLTEPAVLRSWPAVMVPLEACPGLRWKHWKTEVVHRSRPGHPALGYAIWGVLGLETDRVGVGWRWGEMARGIVAMKDPMTLYTNIRLIDSMGQELGPEQAAMRLNVCIRALPWQRLVSDRFGPNQ
jgi:hypothetical protein